MGSDWAGAGGRMGNYKQIIAIMARTHQERSAGSRERKDVKKENSLQVYGLLCLAIFRLTGRKRRGGAERKYLRG